MDAKKYLSKAYSLERRISVKLEEIRTLNELATKVTSTLSDMPHNPNRSKGKLEGIVVKMADMEKEIDDDIDRLIDLKSEIRRVLYSLENPVHQSVLELRYIQFKEWRKIASELKYDLHYLYRIHRNALQECEKMIPDTKRYRKIP